MAILHLCPFSFFTLLWSICITARLTVDPLLSACLIPTQHTMKPGSLLMLRDFITIELFVAGHCVRVLRRCRELSGTDARFGV